MTWLQVRDGASGPLSQAFGVNAIPHTFTIDADGVLQDEHIGDGGIEGKLKKLCSRARQLGKLPRAERPVRDRYFPVTDVPDSGVRVILRPSTLDILKAEPGHLRSRQVSGREDAGVACGAAVSVERNQRPSAAAMAQRISQVAD